MTDTPPDWVLLKAAKRGAWCETATIKQHQTMYRAEPLFRALCDMILKHEQPPVCVPEGQTPLDRGLTHRLLDVINEGAKARDTGASSPYHGHSLEHCLHATGWVQRDLRLALDAAQGKHEQPPVDRKLLCAREACDEKLAITVEGVEIGLRAIELWESGFGK